MRRLSRDLAGWAVGIALVALLGWLLWLRPLLNAPGVGQVPHDNPGPTLTVTAAPTPSPTPISTPTARPRPPTPEPSPTPAGPVLGTGDYPQTVKPGTTPVPDPRETHVYGQFGETLNATGLTVTIARLPPDTSSGGCFFNGADPGKELIGYSMTVTWSGFKMHFPHLEDLALPIDSQGPGNCVDAGPQDFALGGVFTSGVPYRVWWELPVGVAATAEIGFGFTPHPEVPNSPATWFFYH